METSGKIKLDHRDTKRKIRLTKKQIIIALSIIILAALLMVSAQLYKHGIILGNDMMFHFNRFYEAYMQIKTGDFNYFQSIFSFDQSGRIVNALYGPDFSYLQGLLMFFTKNWFRYQLLTSFLCFFIAGLAMFSLASKARVHYKFSIFISLLYMSSSMVSHYALSQNMTSWGAAFIPFIYIPAVRVIQDQERPIKPIELALAVTSVGFLHNLTLFLGILSSIPFYIVGFLRTKHKGKMIKNFFIAVFLTILLNINTLIGFLEVSLTNQLVYPKFFDDVLSYTTYFDIGDNNYSSLGLIFSCLMLFQVFYLFINWKKTSILERLLTLVGMVFLILSTNFIPWEDISLYTDFVQIIQFPRRFVLVAYIFLLIAFAYTLEKLTENLNIDKKKVMYSFLCVVSFLMIANVNLKVLQSAEAWESDTPTSSGNNASWVTTNDPDELRAAFASDNYGDAFKAIKKPTPDYLPLLNGTTQEELDEMGGYKMYNEQVVNNKLNVSKTIDQKNRLVLTWRADNDKEDILPTTVYTRSQINFNGNKLSSDQVQKTTLGAPIVQSKKGINKFIIGYNPLVNTKLLMSIKFVTIVSLFVFGFAKIVSNFIYFKQE
ncbi:hypothetical protein LQF67_10720 [Tetragenococcus halophilus]|uniref:hypothetical protein n=1 Tax=Tetragenococcus halophilus TaxID=51669 RepID=UPI001F1FDDFA|nr:hypothetical protein [Tetragenococcus halophilus]MCF1686030.1 hypothetical protein [Tetragenococcus halophilus]